MKLTYYCKRAQLTKSDLAHTTGVSVRQIRDIEAGRVDVRKVLADAVLRLTQALECSFEHLLGFVGLDDDGMPMYEDDFEWIEFEDPSRKISSVRQTSVVQIKRSQASAKGCRIRRHPFYSATAFQPWG